MPTIPEQSSGLSISLSKPLLSLGRAPGEGRRLHHTHSPQAYRGADGRRWPRLERCSGSCPHLLEEAGVARQLDSCTGPSGLLALKEGSS